jgi:hypothetical protein
MEFYAPVNNNLKVMPGNNDLLVDEYVSPTDAQINSVIDTGENLARRAIGFLTAGQRNAIIFWIDEHPEFMQEYMASINEFVPAERQINDIIYMGEDDHEIVNIIGNIGLLPAIDTYDESSDEESSGEESSGEESSGEESSGEESSDDEMELTDDEDDEDYTEN